MQHRNPLPVVLVAARDPWLAHFLVRNGFEVLIAKSGVHARELVAKLTPDVAVIDSNLDDMRGTEACRLLASNSALPRHAPILILTEGMPSPELRTTALRVGALDFVQQGERPESVIEKIASYVEAKRAFGEATGEGFADPVAGFRTRLALARKARELGSLMSHLGTGYACVVVEVSPKVRLPDLGHVVEQAARLSDVIGDFGVDRAGLLAPATDGGGALRLAARIGAAVRRSARSRGLVSAETPAAELVAAGYDAVSNSTQSQFDPFSLMQHAAAAVREGTPDPGLPWVRRFHPLRDRNLFG